MPLFLQGHFAILRIMKKQAVLITAYKDSSQLFRLAELMHDKYQVYIHIDTKNADKFDIQGIAAMENVHVYSRYRITWGSINHLYALIYLMKKALQDKEITYMHLISAQDILIKPLDGFEDDERIYMDFAEAIPDRWERYNFFQRFDQHSRLIEHMYQGTVKIQKLLHIKRKRLGSFKKIYKGTVWCSMPRAAAEYTDEYIRVYPAFLKSMYTCYLPEECFFQTLFMNSQEWKDRIVNGNLCYTDWNERDGVRPATLDESDYDRIINSGKYFARKIDPQKSAGLMKMLLRQR